MQRIPTIDLTMHERMKNADSYGYFITELVQSLEQKRMKNILNERQDRVFMRPNNLHTLFKSLPEPSESISEFSRNVTILSGITIGVTIGIGLYTYKRNN